MDGIVFPIGQFLSMPKGKFTYYPEGTRIAAMQTVHETRRDRLNMLLKKHGTFAKLNEELGWPRTDSRLSRIKNANVRTDRDGKVFQMGDAIAREIESKLGLPDGWMDTPLTYAEQHGTEDPKAKALAILERIPEDEWPKALRLLDALREPAPRNGTED